MCPATALFSGPNFDPLKIGIVVAPNVPISLHQVFRSPTPSTLFSDRNNFAPRAGFAWQPQRFQRLVLRGGYGVYFERTGGAIKADMQLSSPFFIYQNVPSPVDMANPYPEVNINPFQVPYNVTILRDANGGATWRRFDGSAFPATSPFSRQEPHVYRSVHPHALHSAVDLQRPVRDAEESRARRPLRRLARHRSARPVESFGAGLGGRV